MKKNSDFIKHYAVKVESEFGKQGSGILIKVSDDKCYLITAKHNFTQSSREDSWKDVYENSLKQELSHINISQGKENICQVMHIVNFCNDYDAVIFEVKEYKDEFKKLAKINILYEDNYGSEYEYFFHGYPQGKRDGSDDIVENLRATNDNHEKYTYTVSNDQPLKYNDLQGFSGSGVFIKDNARYYLVGIVIQRTDGFSSFTIFNLPRFINEKEASLKYLLTKNILDLEKFSDMQDLIIKRNSNNLLVQQYKSIFAGESYLDSKLPDKAKEVEYLIT